MDVIKRVHELTQKLRVVQGRDELSREAQHNATLMFFSLLRCMLASRRVLEEHKLTDRSFNWLLGEVETRFNQVLTQTAFLFLSRAPAHVLMGACSEPVAGCPCCCQLQLHVRLAQSLSGGSLG